MADRYIRHDLLTPSIILRWRQLGFISFLCMFHSIFSVILYFHRDHLYEGESKSKGKIHLTALIEVTVDIFTYNFST